jgi:hypothetical protein
MLAHSQHGSCQGTVKHARAAAFALGLAVIALTISVPAPAQINGPPASVTSTGFGGHFDRAPGPKASVTSLGPNGAQPNNQFPTPPTCCINPLFPSQPLPPANRPHHPHRNSSWVTPIYVPYYSPAYVAEPEADPSPDPVDERGGPTIFDRRGNGQARRPAASQYASRRDSAASSSSAPADAAPAEDQPQTLLIYKDGHQDEVQNYAVVGDMLYDLTPGRHRKIALADLDLKATAQQNDDAGINFQVPVSSDKP